MPSESLESVYLLATLDTKGAEAAYLRQQLESHGVSVQVVDTGCLGSPAFPADIARQEVFDAAGSPLSQIVQAADRGRAVSVAALGATRLIADRHRRGLVAGVLGIGGSAGTTIGTSAMRALPLGVPKLMVSTLASGQVRHFVGATKTSSCSIPWSTFWG